MIGQRIGDYEILSALKSGGMGDVLLARRHGPAGFEQLCAVKTVRAELAATPVARAMFLDEARLLARLSHPGIAQIIDFGEASGVAFMVMEYVPGMSFRGLSDKAAPPAVVCQAVAQACRGLHAAPRAARSDRRPPAGRGPSRHQPRQPDARVRRSGQGPRLWHRAGPRTAGPGDRAGHAQGQAAVHVARAAQEPRARSAVGRVLDRGRAVGAAGARAAIPWRLDLRGGARGRGAGDRPAVESDRRLARRSRRRGAGRAGARAVAAAGQRGGDGRGPRADRGARRRPRRSRPGPSAPWPRSASTIGGGWPR
jgi:hypothetical protein